MDKFLRLYKEFFNSKEGKNQFHLTPLELKVYLNIELQRSFLLDTTIIHIDTLLFLLGKKTTSRDRKQIEEVLKELSDKEVINILEECEGTYKIENTFSDSKEHQFEKITIEELHYVLKEIESDSLLYLYLTLRAWENQEGNTNFSNDALSNICQTGKRTVQRNLKQLQDEKLISIQRGKYRKNIIRTLGFTFCKMEKELEPIMLKPTCNKDSLEDIKRAFGI